VGGGSSFSGEAGPFGSFARLNSSEIVRGKGSAMIFDPEQHEKNQGLYLATLLSVVEAHEKQNPDGSGVIVGLREAEVAKATGHSRIP
jgi:hypothetical protein